ncbi:MAG: hypothetical protein ACXAD7_11205 [Candidatus Kariarchaeaceae archaeon]|jgi:hypothetical protein
MSNSNIGRTSTEVSEQNELSSMLSAYSKKNTPETSQTSRNRSLKKMKWHHVCELILPLFLILTPLILAINGKTLFGYGLSDWLLWYSLDLPSVVILSVITVKTIGINDFRFKLFLHASVLQHQLVA